MKVGRKCFEKYYDEVNHCYITTASPKEMDAIFTAKLNNAGESGMIKDHFPDSVFKRLKKKGLIYTYRGYRFHRTQRTMVRLKTFTHLEVVEERVPYRKRNEDIALMKEKSKCRRN